MRFLCCCIILLAIGDRIAFSPQALSAPAQGPLSALVRALREADDPQFQLDVLKGMSDGLKGHRNLTMPAGWDDLARKLKNDPNPDIRELTRRLSVIFGSKDALQELRRTVVDSKLDEAPRRAALDSLVAA